MDEKTLNKVLRDIGMQRKYSAKDVMDLLQIGAAALSKLEKEGKLVGQGRKLLPAAWYSPVQVLRLLERR